MQDLLSVLVGAVTSPVASQDVVFALPEWCPQR